jgi:glycosyltransferase involved in cell wall biosynthesis
MAAAGIFLAPRPTEALGLSVLEAMSAALPVVAAAAGGHLETVGTVRGAALFPPGDTRRLAGHLRRLADDAESRAASGRDLLDVQRARFTVESQAVATEAVYRSVL